MSPILYATWGILAGHNEASSLLKHMWKEIWFTVRDKKPPKTDSTENDCPGDLQVDNDGKLLVFNESGKWEKLRSDN